MVTVRVPAQFSPLARTGKAAFEAKCAACHGKNASGIEGKGPPLVHKYYHPGHHGDAAFFQAAHNGVRSHHWRFGDMPPVEGLTDADIKAIVRYVRELQKENGIF
nr:cytochrome c [Jhaorihella thermophila]